MDQGEGRYTRALTHTLSLSSFNIKELKRNFTLLERAVETIETRFTTRVLRTLPSIRRRLTSSILSQVISEYYGTGMLYYYRDSIGFLTMDNVDASQASELLNYLGEVCMRERDLWQKVLIYMAFIVEQYWYGCRQYKGQEYLARG